MKKEKLLRRWRASLKPSLTEQNKLVRVQYALDMISDLPQHVTRQSIQRTFKDSMNYVHIDEKCFYLIKDGAKYLLVFDEEPPTLSVTHKKNIRKILFLCAISRPCNFRISPLF